MKSLKILFLLSIPFLFIFVGCGNKKEDISPIDMNIEAKIPELNFESPYETYIKNQKFTAKTLNEKDVLEEKINLIVNYIQVRNYTKAIELIQQERLADSNPYNQLTYYQLIAFCYEKTGQSNKRNQELSNFFELYNRLLSN
ncbi:MAG: hypothetical protein C0601_03560 [Candidatus Muiribacterium halophilum]|uniref:Outer membrane lipoprotein BamD-like domain-containing protein n=1 Tax=Muiribacterium halophilum TaxID=2053465 RepID=A0A2N5ZJS1_MUIH1|nr:MAG: hypothetical protein C0601_03560 [Candidatus Muirbacterium halophilum]